MALNSRAARTAMSLLLALTLAGSLGAAAPMDVDARYERLSHQMMCTCGCAQILGECNHVGCPNSPGELQTLRTDLTGGMADHAVLVDFEEKYGATALASPLLTRFNQAAWIVPPAVLMLGMLCALLVMRRWRERGRAEALTAPAADRLSPQQLEALARVRRETGDQ